LPSSGPDRSLTREPARRQETSSPERRRSPRTKPSGLTYVKLEPDNGGALVDVCESGIRFQVVAPVEERGRIQLWFVLDGINHLEVAGELVWIDETRRSGGLKFTRPSERVREQLLDWLAHHDSPRAIEESPAPRVEELQLHGDGRPLESDSSRPLIELPETEPAPLEALLSQIQATLQRPNAEEMFQRPSETPNSAPLAAAVPRSRTAGPSDGVRSLPGNVLTDVPRSPNLVEPPTDPISADSRAQVGENFAESPALPLSPTSSELDFAQFTRAVNRVGADLSPMRRAIATNRSETLKVSPTEVRPAGAAPDPLPVIEPAPQPAADVADLENERIADSEFQPDLDVRPWAAGAPWRPAESPEVTSSSRTKLVSRTSDFIHSVRRGIEPQLSRTQIDGTDSLTAAMRHSRVAGAPFLATAERSSRAATRWRPGDLLHALRAKLTNASSGVKRVSSTVLSAVVPEEPTPSDIWTMLGISVVLLASLVAFSYRDKLDSILNSFDGTSTSEFSRRGLAPAPSSPSTEPPARTPKARRAAPSPARLYPARTEPQAVTRRSSTPELETALAYLGDDSRERDPSTAAQWLWAATRKGDTAANILLADLYIRGEGVPQNCAQGRVLLLAASQKGNDEATRKLQEVDASGCGSTEQ